MKLFRTILNGLNEGLDNLKKEIKDDVSDLWDDIKSIPSDLISPNNNDDDDDVSFLDEIRALPAELFSLDDDDDDDYNGANSQKTTGRSVSKSKRGGSSNIRKVIIRGVYQMNGPKPFRREIECSQSEVGYYTQLMGNKKQQAQWLQANFPGANTERGFSMSVNIK